MSAEPSAPHQLNLVIDFVNTLDREDGGELLTTPAALAGWLSERGLLEVGTSVGEPELAEARELRESLRSVMLAHNGGERPDSAEAQLAAVAERGELGVHFEPGGSIRLGPRVGGLAGALAALLIPVAQAIGDGSWSRVKACRAADCEWAFYDRSRNRSGTWCDMAVCGNRTKVRAYRSRR
ncbi:MAG: CGNR zinc finger domain-containing protein [Solirubrobacteraceae bacterium]